MLGFKSFKEARTFVRGLVLKSSQDWQQYSKSGKKPTDIPADPPAVYKRDWKGWGDWLGPGMITDQNKHFLQFEEARAYVYINSD